jgi:hypothetical protein
MVLVCASAQGQSVARIASSREWSQAELIPQDELFSRDEGSRPELLLWAAGRKGVKVGRRYIVCRTPDVMS